MVFYATAEVDLLNVVLFISQTIYLYYFCVSLFLDFHWKVSVNKGVPYFFVRWADGDFYGLTYLSLSIEDLFIQDISTSKYACFPLFHKWFAYIMIKCMTLEERTALYHCQKKKIITCMLSITTKRFSYFGWRCEDSKRDRIK